MSSGEPAAPAAIALEAEAEAFRRDFAALRGQLERVVLGQNEALEAVLTALLAGGHVLVEGMPGLGKTMLARAVAEAAGLEYRRVQFTPDLMPADVIGTYVVMESHGRRKFEFQQGPLFTNVLLADEINRATPKTQAGLLEGLSEGSVSVANETYDLPAPFFVVATQTEGETDGTFPLPETELDRFFFHLALPVPSAADLPAILQRMTLAAPASAARVVDANRLLHLRQVVRHVGVADDIWAYVANLILRTHPNHPTATPLVRRFLRRGASPRGGAALILAAKVRALVAGRTQVVREDLSPLAPLALRHRLALNYDGHASQTSRDQIIAEVLAAG